MRIHTFAIHTETVFISLGAVATGLAIFFGTVIGRDQVTNFISSLWGGSIKTACIKYKEEMSSHANANPFLTGNYNSFADPVIKEWNEKGDAINKRLFDAVGISYSTGDEIEEAQKNIQGLMQAAQKCYNAGVDFGGMKELKEFSKGFN
jgi:hypothetical protein